MRITRDTAHGAIAATMTPRVAEILFPTAVVRRAGRLLRRPVRVAGHRIDIRRSVDASIRAIGYPTIRKGLESRTPDCLMLVDRVSRNDHLSALADALAKRLRDGGADLLRYEFREVPDVLEAVGRRFGGQPVVSLSALARRHPGARVVVVGTGRGFFEPYERNTLRMVKPFFGEPEAPPFVDHQPQVIKERRQPRVLPAFRDPPILVTPSPPDRWGPAEQSLLDAGFVVISLGSAESPEAGLEAAVEAVITGRRPQAADRRIIAQATPGHDPLLMELDRAELASEIAPDQALRDRLARRVMAYACAPIGEEVERDSPGDPAAADDFPMRARAGMAALALFPRLDPAFTPALWQAAAGHAPSATRLARLARLPWFRAGRMPDWLRSDLARCFQKEVLAEAERGGRKDRKDRWTELREKLTAFAGECLDRTPDSFSAPVYSAPKGLENLLSRLRLLRAAAEPETRSLVEERLFLTFLESGEIATEKLAVDLPQSDRPTPAMRLGLLGFTVAAVVAAAFAPWALRAVNSLLNSIFGRETGEITAFAAILAEIGLGLSLIATVSLCAVTLNFIDRKGASNVLAAMIVTSLLSHVISYHILSSILEDGSNVPFDIFTIFYTLLNMIIVICFVVTSRRIHINSKQELVGKRPVEFHKHQFVLGAASAALYVLYVTTSATSGVDAFILTFITCVVVLFMSASRQKFNALVMFIISSITWQLLLGILFAGLIDLILVSEILSRDPEYIGVILYVTSMGICAVVTNIGFAAESFSGAARRSVFLWLAGTVVLFFPYSSVMGLFGWGVAGVAVAVAGWYLARWIAEKRAADRLLRLHDYVADTLGFDLLGRFGYGLDWVDLALKAALAGAVASLVSYVVATALLWPFGSVAAFIENRAVGFPELVLTPGFGLAGQAAAVLAIFLAVSFLCRLAFALYPVEAEAPASAGRSWMQSPWWAVPALWLVAVVPRSLPDWFSAAGMDLSIAGQSDDVVAQGVLAIGSVEAAVAWLQRALFGLGSGWHSLSYLALPVAMVFGIRGGPDADRPIFIGLLPFLFAASFLSTSTPGGFWMIPTVFLLLRLAREPELLRPLLRFGGGLGGWPANPLIVFALVFGLAALLAPAVDTWTDNDGGETGVRFTILPGIVQAAAFVLIGAMRLPRRQVLAAIGLHIAAALAYGDRLTVELADTNIQLSLGLTLGAALDLLLAYAAVPIARTVRSGWLVALFSTRALMLWLATVIALWAAIAIATVLDLVSGVSIRIDPYLDYVPTGVTVAILSLTLGMVVRVQHPLRLHLSMLGGVMGAVALSGPLVGYLAAAFPDWFGGADPNLTSPIADVVAALPSLGLVFGFMMFGNAVEPVLLAEAVEAGPVGGASARPRMARPRTKAAASEEERVLA
ncbi:hypothetical protein RB623_09370 [Mesorhizobium sp. LHD-90]|uniref:hypothetical protein n=1 Tax=Mesorhizobium sp. LHD-90 TaxID=3071414 RepID=UPI0027DF4BC0|nr:hypothetical protein [Mesorhizobium sp. LHD-90]MDQ6434258.1 hypothetical protein [Mesorhizobium sp. LHD-90]